MAESFDGDWLDLREPHDAAARNMELAELLAASLPARPRILDLGAGTGSLLRWLGHFIGRAQSWTLVDSDAELISRAFDTISERAEAVDWPVTQPGRSALLVHAPQLPGLQPTPPSVHRPKHRQHDTMGLALRPQGVHRGVGAKAVHQEPNLNPPNHRRKQRLHDSLSSEVVIENVGGHPDFMSRQGDGFDHRREQLIPALQQIHMVATTK
jgi:hypothetical protein